MCVHPTKNVVGFMGPKKSKYIPFLTDYWFNPFKVIRNENFNSTSCDTAYFELLILTGTS